MPQCFYLSALLPCKQGDKGPLVISVQDLPSRGALEALLVEETFMQIAQLSDAVGSIHAANLVIPMPVTLRE